MVPGSKLPRIQGWGRNCRNSRRPFVYLTKYTLGSLWEADYQRVLPGTGFNLRNFLWSSESNVIRYLMGIGIDALALIKKKKKNKKSPTLKCYIPFNWEFLSTAQLLLNPSLPWTLLWSSTSNCLYWVHIQGTPHLLHSTQWCHPDPPITIMKLQDWSRAWSVFTSCLSCQCPLCQPQP